MKILKFMFGIIKKYPRQFLTTLALLVVLNVIEMGSVLIVAPLVDLITKPDLKGISVITVRLLAFLKWLNLPETIYSVLILMFCFALLRFVVFIMVHSSVLKTKYALCRDVICDTYGSFFNSSWNFFVSNSHGLLGNTFIKEAGKVGDYFGHMVIIFVTIFRAILYFVIAFFVSWKLSLIIALLSIIFTLPFSLIGKLTYKLGKINLATANKIYEIIQESLSAAKITIGFGNQKRGISLLEKSVNTHVSATLKSQLVEVATPTVFQPIGIAIILLSVFLSSALTKIPLAELSVILFAFYSAVPLLGQVVAVKNTLLNFFPSYEQITNLRRIADSTIQPSGTINFERFNHKICFESVNFSYAGHPRVLQNINIVVPKGKMVALVGKSGAGKSTLIDLLFRFYEVDSGSIAIDGIDLKQLNILSWRHKIGYVPQDSFLFNTTLRENLIWAKEDATEEEIVYACKIANADDFIKNLPKGLGTLVGDRGVRLSGGQRQRITLARAILRKPELLILDEATSSLDSHSERLIQEAIENISHETTVIIIAHRLSTVTNAYKIYLIDQGTIIEEGNFSELYAKKGKYYELARAQGMTL